MTTTQIIAIAVAWIAHQVANLRAWLVRLAIVASMVGISNGSIFEYVPKEYRHLALFAASVILVMTGHAIPAPGTVQLPADHPATQAAAAAIKKGITS